MNNPCNYKCCIFWDIELLKMWKNINQGVFFKIFQAFICLLRLRFQNEKLERCSKPDINEVFPCWVEPNTFFTKRRCSWNWKPQEFTKHHVFEKSLKLAFFILRNKPFLSTQHALCMRRLLTSTFRSNSRYSSN